MSAAPIFTALLALAFDHDERSQGWAAIGIVVGMLGVVLLFGLDLSGSGDQVVGGLMVLLASLCYAIGAMLLKHKLPGAPPVGIAGGQMAVAAVVTLPLCLAALPDHAPSLKATGALVLLGVAGTGLAFLWFYTLISEIGPARASVIAYIAPGFSVVYGVILLGEPFSVAAVGGLALILAGSWLAVGGRAPGRRARDRAAAARWRPRPWSLSAMATGVRRPARPARDAVRRATARSTSTRSSASPSRCSTPAPTGSSRSPRRPRPRRSTRASATRSLAVVRARRRRAQRRAHRRRGHERHAHHHRAPRGAGRRSTASPPR